MGVKHSDLWELVMTTFIGSPFSIPKLPPDDMTDLEYRLINRVRAENYYRIKNDIKRYLEGK